MWFYRCDKFGVSRKVNGIDSYQSKDTGVISATDSRSVLMFRGTSYISYNNRDYFRITE